MENNKEEKEIIGCKVCGASLITEEEKELKWCTRHLDELDKMCGW